MTDQQRSKSFPYTATYRWDGGFAALQQYDGQQMLVLRSVRADEADAEVGPMFHVRFPDGHENDAYPDEIEVEVGATEQPEAQAALVVQEFGHIDKIKGSK